MIGMSIALYAGAGFEALVLAVVSGRAALVLACMRGIPAARADGLGAAVAGSVPPVVAVIWAFVVGGLAAALALVIGWAPLGAIAAALIGLLATAVILIVARRRLGGVTGDVLGACVEVTTTTVLVVLALLP